jgi:hypothetical protein
MNKESYNRAKTDLYNIVSNLAHEDYLQSNTNKQGKRYKKHRPYNLSDNTMEAQEIYRILFMNTHDKITIEQETKIKASLIIFRTVRSEYIKS